MFMIVRQRMFQRNGQVVMEDLEELFAETQSKKHLRIASQVD
jgi:hypothetical protein